MERKKTTRVIVHSAGHGCSTKKSCPCPSDCGSYQATFKEDEFNCGTKPTSSQGFWEYTAKTGYTPKAGDFVGLTVRSLPSPIVGCICNCFTYKDQKYYLIQLKSSELPAPWGDDNRALAPDDAVVRIKASDVTSVIRYIGTDYVQRCSELN
ncbi:MAG: hypothetical protein RLZ12_312 [Bacillota bacterium]|jgi:hypothetical protein